MMTKGNDKMSLTSVDIYNKEFKKKFSVWSYDDSEVDEFLDVVGTYYEQVIAENRKLKEDMKKIEEKMNDWKEFEKSINDTMSKADKIVTAKKEEAVKEADLIIKEAELKANRIVSDAQLKSDQIISDAQNKVEEKYKQYQELVEHKKLFEIRFKTLLKTNLEMLEDDEVELKRVKEELDIEE